MRSLEMPIAFIESLDDARLDIYRSLKRTNETRWKGQFVVEGEVLVERMLMSGWPTISVLVAAERADTWSARVPSKIPVLVLPVRDIRQLVGFDFHRGILACGKRPAVLALDRLDSHLRGNDEGRPGNDSIVIAICIDIHDPVNIGAILRTSRTFGVDGVLLSPRCADPFSRRVMRTSMGAPFDLPIAILEGEVMHSLAELRARYGFTLAATVVDPNATPIESFPIPKRLAILFGNEGRGLESSITANCDARLTIPMAGAVDSLNVAVAAGIVLHEFRRKSGMGRQVE